MKRKIPKVEKQFATEFDYRREAANLALVRGNLARSRFAHLVVPAPHLELCTKCVLVMDEVPRAQKLTDAVREIEEKREERYKKNERKM